MLKNYLFSPLCLAPFLCSSPLFLFLSAPHTSFSFSVSWSAAPFFLLFSSRLLFLFYRSVALYFSAQNTFFLAQTFFSPKVFQFFSPNVFASVQPLFSSSSFLQTCCSFKFSLLFFQCLLFFFSLAPFIQGPIFSLVASHLFYLNKSLFSSNLE